MRPGYILALACLAGPAQAHAFKGGADLYARFGEGIGIVLTDPRLILAPLTLGIAAALANPTGFPRQWAFLLIGAVAGQLIAPTVPPFVMVAALLAAALTAILAMAMRFRLLDAAALLVGVATGAAALEGHSFLEVPIMLRIGLCVGISALAAIPAALAAMSLTRFPQPVTPILWRIAASWCAAIAIMLTAFTLKGL